MHSLHRLPADTESGCFAHLLRCLLCGGTVATRPSAPSPDPHSTRVSISTTLLQSDNVVGNVPGRRAEREVPIVARLMGLETPVDMSWVPRKKRADDDDEYVRRSRSVNSVDCLVRLGTKPAQVHRRVKTSLSFREVPVGDFLVLSLEKSKDLRQDRPEAKTENRKGYDRRIVSISDRRNIRRQSKQTRPINTDGNVTHMDQNDLTKNGKLTKRTTNPSKSAWQHQNDYYKRPHATKTKSPRKEAKMLAKSKHKTMQAKNVKPESSVPDGLCRRATRRASSAGVSPRTEDRRGRRKGGIEDESAKTFGELMMKRIKLLIERDLKMKRWYWKNEAAFLFKDYLSMEIELGIFDELLNQIVLDLALKL